MANKQIDELSELTTASGSDLLLVYDLNEAGSEKSKKIELYNAIGYEEGTWTPVVYDADSGGNAASTGTSLGTYTKIGRQVTINCHFSNIDTSGLTSGNDVHIGGLPFARQTTVHNAYVEAAMTGYVAFTNMIFAYWSWNIARIKLYNIVQGDQQSFIIVSGLTSTTADLRFTMTYEI
jgi:hypothetical protein